MPFHSHTEKGYLYAYSKYGNNTIPSPTQEWSQQNTWQINWDADNISLRLTASIVLVLFYAEIDLNHNFIDVR